MAKNTQPVLKRCKTLGLSPAVLGYSKSTKRQPKQTAASSPSTACS